MNERTPNNGIAAALHESAMRISDEAGAAKRREVPKAARSLYLSAARLEEAAFDHATSQGPHSVDDPQRTVNKAVLGQRAASLYVNAERYRAAVRVAKKTLDQTAGMPVYDDVRRDLAVVAQVASRHVGLGRLRSLLPER